MFEVSKRVCFSILQLVGRTNHITLARKTRPTFISHGAMCGRESCSLPYGRLYVTVVYSLIVSVWTSYFSSLSWILVFWFQRLHLRCADHSVFALKGRVSLTWTLGLCPSWDIDVCPHFTLVCCPLQAEAFRNFCPSPVKKALTISESIYGLRRRVLNWCWSWGQLRKSWKSVTSVELTIALVS